MPSIPEQSPERTSLDHEEERHYWESLEDDERKAHERRERARRAAIKVMEEWFYKHFEDPQNEMPRDHDDGDCVYPWGGPFDATNVITERFDSEYEEGWIGAVVEEIERGGTVEWAPTEYGDYYEHPEPDDVVANASAEIIARLDTLEAALAELKVRPSNIGHNIPPEDIGLPPYDERDAAELRTAISHTRSELAAPAPNPVVLQRLSDRFDRLRVAVGKWLAEKADLIVDETIKSSIQAGSWAMAVTMLTDVARQISRLAEHIISKL